MTGEAAPRLERRLPLLMAAVVLADFLGYSVVTPLVPGFVHGDGLSPGAAGLVVGGYALGTFLFSVPTGLAAARFGGRNLVVLGLVLDGAATAGVGLGHSFLPLFGARLLAGLGGASAWAGALSWLALTAVPERRAQAFGICYSGAAFGALVGPAVGGLAAGLGRAPVLGAAGAATLLLVVPVLRLPAAPREPARGLAPLRGALGDRRLQAGLTLMAVAGLAFGAVEVLGPLRLSALRIGTTAIAATFLVAAGIEALAAPTVGSLADRYGPARPIVGALLGALAVCVVGPLARPGALLAVLLALVVPSMGLLFSPATEVIARAADERGLTQGLAAAVLNLTWSIGATAGAAGAGALAGGVGQWLPYLLVGLVVALTLTAVLRRPGRRPARTPHPASAR